jgi:hypothetical protein
MNYEIKKMSTGEILDTASRVFKDNLVPLFGISFGLQAAILFLTALIETIFFVDDADVWAAVAGLVAVVLMLFMAPFVTAISTRYIADRYLGRDGGLGSAFKASIGIFIPLLFAIILGSIFMGIGMILLVIPGFYLMLRFSLIAPATVVERRGGMAALGRSGMLVKGAYGKLLLLFVIQWVAILFSALPAFLIFGEGMTTDMINAVISALVGSFFAVVWTVTYFERRCEHEGFDMQLLAQSFSDEQ